MFIVSFAGQKVNPVASPMRQIEAKQVQFGFFVKEFSGRGAAEIWLNK